MKFALFLTSLLILSLFYTGYAQETTGSLEGRVTDANNQPIAFATVLIVDTATNAKYGTISTENGHYSIQNLSPGSAYKLEASFIGYRNFELEAVTIYLGEVTRHQIELQESSLELDEVIVTAAEGQSKGNFTVLNKKAIDRTPTINRGIQDLTRNIPQNNLNSFAGPRNRFNNLNIDGIANNDVIGFQEPASGAAGSAANGTPGSLSQSQPIGFGAIKQLSVKLSPFDVSVGNFIGANVNVVTKNGTNTLSGEVYGFGNNQALVGKYADGVAQDRSGFYDYQWGLGVGGPILKDKLFFYLNFEQGASKNPVLNAPGATNSNIALDDVTRISEHLQNNYQYDPGTYESAQLRTSSTKLFTRLDYNLSQIHKLTLRNNFVDSYADNLEWSSSIFNFGNQGYRHNSKANSLALELKSNFQTNWTNNLTLGYNTVQENRTFNGRVFPHVQIASNATNRIFAGTYREASVYSTDFSTFQMADKLTRTFGKGHLTFGGLFQYNKVDYGFLSAWNGRWEYASVDDFLADQPRRVRGVYHVSNNDYDFVSNRPSASIGIIESALYLQYKTQWNDRLSTQFGLRMDGQFLTEPIPIAAEVLNTPEFSHFTNEISKKPQLNPRFGFNYALDADKNYTLKGGTGLFSGRIPYLWFAYAEYISGTEYLNIDLRPTESLLLTENLGELQNQQPNLTEINLIDTDFTFPRDWKSTLALNVNLPNQWKFNLEGSYTKVIEGLFFKSINRKEVFETYDGADNRRYYSLPSDEIKINPNFTNVFVLSNTNKGYRYNLSFGLDKTWGKYVGYLGYTYGKSKDVSSTVRNSPAANYEWNQAIFGNDPELAYSNFDLRHRIVSTHSYEFDLGIKSSLLGSLLYTARSGSPYSFVYQGDVNRDGSSRNDLVFVPARQSDIQLVPITDSDGNVVVSPESQWQALDAYIEANGYLRERRGTYAERNGAKTPWNHQLDMKWVYSKRLGKGQRLSVSLDMYNVFNFINKDWGRLVYVPNVLNSSFSLLRFAGVENNVPQYQFNIDSNDQPWLIDSESSRWKAQFGITYAF
jgi:hypothetical protein